MHWGVVVVVVVCGVCVCVCVWGETANEEAECEMSPNSKRLLCNCAATVCGVRFPPSAPPCLEEIVFDKSDQAGQRSLKRNQCRPSPNKPRQFTAAQQFTAAPNGGERHTQW